MPTRHGQPDDSARSIDAGRPTGPDNTTRDHETALAPPNWDLLPPTEMIQRHRRGSAL
jgi:hypothetical protein